MSFTYIAGSGVNRDRLRQFLNDTVEDSGPFPQDKNFSNEELDDILVYEGSLQRAQAHCLEQLAVAWFRHPTFQGDGISISLSHVGKNYESQAAELRKRYGYAAGATITSHPVIRVDGYSDNIDSHEVDN